MSNPEGSIEKRPTEAFGRVAKTTERVGIPMDWMKKEITTQNNWARSQMDKLEARRE